MSVETEIKTKVLEYVLRTPLAMAVVIASFLSGHLWLFIIKAVRKRTAGNKILESKTGRTAFGMLWLALIMCPIYMIKYGDVSFELEKIMALVLPSIVFAAILQLIILVVYLVLERK